MTALAGVTPGAGQDAASRLVAALERTWTAIRVSHPEVPEVVVVVAAGSDPRSRRLTLGHFAAGRWQLASPDQAQLTDRPEVLVGGEGLAAARSTCSAALRLRCRRPRLVRPPSAGRGQGHPDLLS